MNSEENYVLYILFWLFYLLHLLVAKFSSIVVSYVYIARLMWNLVIKIIIIFFYIQNLNTTETDSFVYSGRKWCRKRGCSATIGGGGNFQSHLNRLVLLVPNNTKKQWSNKLVDTQKEKLLTPFYLPFWAG